MRFGTQATVFHSKTQEKIRKNIREEKDTHDGSNDNSSGIYVAPLKEILEGKGRQEWARSQVKQ